jgi:hypothetical protein
MSFSASAQNFYLEDGHILRASVADEEGNYQESSIDLDQFIGNEDGWFMWDGESTYSPSLASSAYTHLSISPCP